MRPPIPEALILSPQKKTLMFLMWFIHRDRLFYSHSSLTSLVLLMVPLAILLMELKKTPRFQALSRQIRLPLRFLPKRRRHPLLAIPLLQAGLRSGPPSGLFPLPESLWMMS